MLQPRLHKRRLFAFFSGDFLLGGMIERVSEPYLSSSAQANPSDSLYESYFFACVSTLTDVKASAR
jgi:hypothetical protein